jgi:hypothetical protein
VASAVLLLALLAHSPRAAAALSSCEGSAPLEWTQDWLSRAALDRFYVEAARILGEPRACKAIQTQQFEERDFGELTLQFAQSVTLRFETHPPETSVIELRGPCGWTSEMVGLHILQTAARETGLMPNWDKPVSATDKERSTRTWEDTQPGTNGFVEMVTAQGGVCLLKRSMAL